MKHIDARSLSPSAQEALRRRAVKAVLDGKTHQEVANTIGVARPTVSRWMHEWGSGGAKALKAAKRGRPNGTQLDERQTRDITKKIVTRCPDQLRLPFYLWTREAVGELIQREHRIRLSVWTVGRYLKTWGFTPQKPLRRAYEQNPVAVRRWLRDEYPGIRRQSVVDKAEIHWLDEMGLLSDHQTGRSYGRRGQTPVIPGTGQRFGCQMISTITNRGVLRFLVHHQKFGAPLFLRFLRRLTRGMKRPVYVIADRHPVHRAKVVQQWLHENRGTIRLFFLPTYAPELNPDERLNNDVKSNAVGRQRPQSRSEMIHTVRRFLRSRQNEPHIVRNYFQAAPVRYAAV
jgi:transposase